MANKKITIGLDFDINLAQLNALKAQINMIRFDNNSVKDMSSELKQAVQAADELEDILNSAWNSKIGQLDLSKLNKSIKNSYGNLSNFKKSLEGAGPQGAKLFDNFANSVLKTNIQMKQTNKLLDSMATSMSNTVKWGITSSIFNNITGSIQKAWDYSLKLDSSLNDIRIVTGKSADEMERFARVANASAKDLRASTLDYTQAALIYYQQGLGEEEVQARANTTLKVANVTGQSGQAVSEQLTAVWNGYKVAAEEAELYIDKLSAVAATTAADLEELSTGMSKVASAANAMGVDVDQLNAQLATIISVTRQAPESVGTALKTIYARMGDIEAGIEEDGVTLGDYTEKMAEMGVHVLNAKGELRDMGEVIEEVGNNWNNFTREQQIALAQTMAGTRQYNNLIALFDSWEMYEDALSSSKNSAGELQKQQDIYMESTEAHLQQLATEAERTYDILFDDSAVKTMTSSLTVLLNVFNNLLAGMGGGLSSFAFLGANLANVFSPQIGKALERVQSNKKKEQGNQVQAELRDELLRLYSKNGIDIESKGLKEALPYYQQYSQVQKNMKEDLQLTTEEGIRRVGVLKQEIEEIKAYQEVWKKHPKVTERIEQEGIDVDAMDESGFETSIDFLNEENIQASTLLQILTGKKLDNAGIKQVNDLQMALTDLADVRDRMYSLIESDASGDDFWKQYSGLEEEFETYQIIVKEDLDTVLKKYNIDKNKMSEKTAKIFENTFEKLLNKDIRSLGEIPWEQLESTNKIVDDLGVEIQKIKKDISTARQSYPKYGQDEKGKIVNVAESRQTKENTLNIEKGILKDIFNSQKIQENITTLTKGLTSILSIGISISGVYKTLTNESLSDSEKIAQVLPVVVVGLTQILTSLKDIKAAGIVVKRLLASFSISHGVRASSKGPLGSLISSASKAKVSVLGVKVALGTLVAVIAAIATAVGALIYVWYKQETAAKNSLKAAQKQSQELKKSFEELTEKVNDFKTKISDYQDGINSLKKLDSTTEEYKNTLEETNNKAKELIESLKLYNNFDVINGQIQINPQVLADLQLELELQAAEVESAYYASEVLTNKKQQEYDLQELADKMPVQHVWKDGWFGTNVGAGNMPVYLQENELSEIIEAIREVKDTDGEKGLIKYAEIMSSAESLQNFIETTYAGEAEIRVFSEEIGRCVSYIDKYIESTDAATQANKYYLQQIVGLDVEKRYGAVLEKMAQDESGQIDNEVYEQLKYIISNSEIQKNAQSGLESDLQVGLTTAEAWSDEVNFRAVGEKNWNSQIGAYLKEYYNTDVQDIFGSDLRNTEEMARVYAKYVKGLDPEKLKTKGKALVDEQGTEVVNFSSKKEKGEIRAGLYNYAVEEVLGEKWQGVAAQDTEEYINAINNLISNAKAAGNKYGVDWTEGLLSALSNPEQEFDLSSTFTTLNPDEVKEIQAMSPDQLMEMLGVTEETIKQAGFDSVEIFAENFKQGFKNHRYSISEDIAQAMAEKAKEFEAIGEDLSKKQLEQYQEDVQVYAKNLMQIAGEEGTGVGEALKYNAEMAVDFALKVVKMNKAIESLADNFKDWNSILKKSKSSSQEYAEAMEGIKTAIADVYDVSSDYISHDFINENLPEIEKIAKGDETAIEGLRDELAQELIFNIGINNGLDEAGAQEQVEKFKGLKEQIQEVLSQNPEMGVDLDTSSFINGLQEIVTNTNMNIGQVQALFSSLGLEPIYETEMVEQTQTNPIIETTTAFSGFNKITLPDGTERWGATTTQVSKQVGTESFTTQVPILSASYDGKPPKIVGAKALPNSSVNNYSKVNTGGPSLNKSSGSKSTPKKKDKIKDSVDRYHDVNIELKKVANQLKDVQDETEKLVGADLIDNLTQQYKLLNEEIALTDKKIALVNEELYGTDIEIGLKQKLKNQNVEFDENTGMISNYSEIVQEKEDYVNSLIKKYEAMSVEEQEKFEETLQKAEDEFKEFLEDIERYDELTTEELEELEEDKKEKLNKIIENNIQQFNLEIELRLEMTQAERDWNEFKKKVIDDIDEDDILGNAQARLKDFHSFYQENAAEGSIQQLTRHINDIFFDIKQMEQGVESNIYGKNIKQAKEHLQEYSEQLREELETIKDYTDEIRQSYLDMMDEAKGEFDKQIEQYEQIADLIDHDLKLLELLGGEKNYKSFSHYYNMQVKNNKEQLDFQRQEMEFWKAEMENAEEGSEKWLKAKENLETTTIAWRELTNKSIEDVQAKYLNAIKLIFEELNNEITSGKGLEYIKEEWDLITRNSEKYLDNINAAYGIEQLRNKYQEAIDNTDSISAQEQLNDLMAKEIAALEEKDKLTEYDVERANKRYEIALKQIALEEAQQNKTSMRLKRDSQGNYSYVFTADEDAVSKAEDELADAQNALYNFDKENYLNNLDELYAAYEEYQEKMFEAAQINDPEERAQKELLINEQYGELINGLTEQNQNIRNNLYESAFEELARLQDKNAESFKNMTQTQKDALMNDLIPQWESGVQQMADKFAGEGGLEEVCKGAMEQISEATQQYKTDLEEVEETSGLAFDKIEQGTDKAIEYTKDLITENDALIKTYENLLLAVQAVIKEWETLLELEKDSTKYAEETLEDTHKYLQTNLGDDNADKYSDNKDYSKGITDVAMAIAGGDGSRATRNYLQQLLDERQEKEDRNPGITSVTTDRLEKLVNAFLDFKNPKHEKAVELVNLVDQGLANYTDEILSSYGFRTGGYTGSWSGDEGRLALLHQKELVLNANDTQNILNAVQIIRSVEGSLLRRMSEMTSNIGNVYSIAENKETLEQNVHIEANFPNVTNSKEVENAIDNLINIAAQRTHRDIK